eukprot:417834-Amphidinium_carterae.1
MSVAVSDFELDMLWRKVLVPEFMVCVAEDDDFDWDDVDMPDAQLNQSRVSKKLSELTTRSRVYE